MNQVFASFDPLSVIPQSDLSILSDSEKATISKNIKNKLGEFVIVAFSPYLVNYELEDILDTVGMDGQMKKLESYLPIFPHKLPRVIEEFKIKFKENYTE